MTPPTPPTPHRTLSECTRVAVLMSYSVAHARVQVVSMLLQSLALTMWVETRSEVIKQQQQQMWLFIISQQQNTATALTHFHLGAPSAHCQVRRSHYISVTSLLHPSAHTPRGKQHVSGVGRPNKKTSNI